MSVSQTYKAPAGSSGSGSGGYLVTEWVEGSQPASWQVLYTVADCHSLRASNYATSAGVQPGECALIHVQLDKEADGKLTFSFRGIPASWQGLRNPYVVDVDFGKWATTVGGGQSQTWQCVYGR
jgi:hypothetical protein